MAVSTQPSIIGAGLYSVTQASRIVRTHRNTVASWVRLGLAPHPVYLVPGEATLLSFADLMSLLVVRELRNAQVPLTTIKKAELFLAHQWDVEKPFSSKRILTAHSAVITALRENEQPVAVTGAAQELLYDLIKQDLKDVTYDARLQARAWRPHAYVLLRPEVQFGAPCIDGTRVTTQTIVDYLASGDTPQEVAADLRLNVAQVTSALDWEQSLSRKN